MRLARCVTSVSLFWCRRERFGVRKCAANTTQNQKSASVKRVRFILEYQPAEAQDRWSQPLSEEEPTASDTQVLHGGTAEDQQQVLIHGLRVERYRETYNSVLQPSILSELSNGNNTDYVSKVLELKHRLWTVLCRPQLVETLMEDGQVEVKEIFDLT